MKFQRFAIVAFAWLSIAALLTPLAYSAWISFSPDSSLSPPRAEWSLRWYGHFFSDRRWTGALAHSLLVGAASACVSLAVGTPLACAVVRYRFAGRRVMSALALLPACVPPAALGMGLLPLVYLAGLRGSLMGLILAHGLMGLPVVYLIARTHFGGENPDWEAAARGLGASPMAVATRVTLPLLKPALMAGAAAAFAMSLNESMVTLFLATPNNATLPALVWPQLRYAASPLVAAASCVSVAIALLAAWAFLAAKQRTEE